MWITVIVIAGISVIMDILALTKIVELWDSSTATVGLVIGVLAIYYGVRGILYHVKKEKTEK